MRRVAVFSAVLLAIAGFAALTVHDFAENGVSAGGVVSAAILVFLAVAILGSLLGGPRD